ncbi:MAG: hypothetical protein U1F77_06315 [Kiritimatiellia bacterium]
MADVEYSKVSVALSDLQKGDAQGLRPDQFTNMVSAVTLLENIGTIEDEKIRLKVVQFSASLFRQSAKLEQAADCYVDSMVEILVKEPSERVRDEAATSLLESVPPRILDRYMSVLRSAADLRRDIATLTIYASLPSCDGPWLLEKVQAIRPESSGDKYQLDSIMARCGNKEATNRLIENAGHLDEISDIGLGHLVNALAFVPSEQVQKVLALGLRSETIVSLRGGGTIPWRNCCARSLVRMHRHDEDFPVKKDYYMYSDDEFGKIERWCVDNIGASFPVGGE